jgi:hypothetical protein
MMTFAPHQPSLRTALTACAALLAGACTPPADPAVAPVPEARVEAATTLAPAEWSARSSAAEIATWAGQGCARPEGGKDACIERMFMGLLEQAGVAKSMEVLDTLVARDPEVAHNAHPLAHGLGIAAYRSPETLAATFASCPSSQMSGCSHGVIQGYFLDLARQGKRIGTAELDALCAPHTETRFLFFQCAHGMGHGLMTVHGNHLPTALETCDLVTDDFAEISCWGGAFMENVVNFTHPHHTAGGHATVQGGGHADHGAGQHASAGHDAHGGQAQGGHDAHGGHGAAGGKQATQHGDWKALDPNDMLYPCNAVAEKYRIACYGMQTSAVMFFNQGDVAATGRVCEWAEAWVATCFMSLGRDITAYAAHDHQRTLEMCARTSGMAGGRGQTWCTVGAVQTLVNLTAEPGDGMRFCRAVSGAEAKSACYRMVGETIADLYAGSDARGRSCLAAESDFVVACRRGAGIEPAGNGSE